MRRLGGRVVAMAMLSEGGAFRCFQHAMLVALSVAVTAVQARAGEKEKEPDAIVELGGSGNWNMSGPFSFGPTVAVEFAPIENWLEIEVGTGPMFGKGIREWDTDILFKKPFTLSDKVEFMFGVGPQWGTALTARRMQASRLRATSCSGRGRIARSDGSWSRVTTIASSAATSGRLE